MKKAKNPTVSAVIPVYNTGRSAKALVENILQSEYAPDDIILVDDGSTDKSLKLLKSIKNKRVHVYHQKNLGASAARNKGLSHVKTDYVIFLDSDDKLKPEFLPSLIESVRDNPGILPVTGMYRHTNKSRKMVNLYPKKLRSRAKDESLRDYVLWLLIQDGRMYPVVNKIFRMDIIRKNNLKFDEKFTFAEDLKFVLDYLKYSSSDIKFIQEPLYIYDFNNETSLTNTTALHWANWQRSFDHLVAWCGKLSPRTMMHLSLVYSRWRVSHMKAQRRDREARKNHKK